MSLALGTAWIACPICPGSSLFHPLGTALPEVVGFMMGVLTLYQRLEYGSIGRNNSWSLTIIRSNAFSNAINGAKFCGRCNGAGG